MKTVVSAGDKRAVGSDLLGVGVIAKAEEVSISTLEHPLGPEQRPHLVAQLFVVVLVVFEARGTAVERAKNAVINLSLNLFHKYTAKAVHTAPRFSAAGTVGAVGCRVGRG